MAKKNKREEIIKAAMTLFHMRGYNSVGINDILEATGIPKGSFYYYFASKEDLIRQAVMHYMAEVIEWTNTYPRNMEGLRSFFRRQFDIIESSDYREGCPVGNMTSELAGTDDELREELRVVERRVNDYVRFSLMNSFQFNDNRASDYATFILFTFQGATIKAKLERENTALRLFDKFIFDMLLRSKELQRRNASHESYPGVKNASF